MGNVKESGGGAEPKPSDKPESQGLRVQKSGLEKAFHYKNTKDFPETTENHLVNIGPGLLNYARQAVLRDWDPNTPLVTEEEREVLRMVSRTTFKGKKL